MVMIFPSCPRKFDQIIMGKMENFLSNSKNLHSSNTATFTKFLPKMRERNLTLQKYFVKSTTYLACLFEMLKSCFHEIFVEKVWKRKTISHLIIFFSWNQKMLQKPDLTNFPRRTLTPKICVCVPQCGNPRKFLSLRFYVKSILKPQKWSKRYFLILFDKPKLVSRNIFFVNFPQCVKTEKKFVKSTL